MEVVDEELVEVEMEVDVCVFVEEVVVEVCVFVVIRGVCRHCKAVVNPLRTTKR